MVQDLRLVENVMNVMAGQPDGATREEMRRHLNEDGGTPRGASPPPPPPPGGAGGLVRQRNFVGGVGSGMGDGSGSEEGNTRGAQGDHDTGHVGTWGGGGSSSRVVTGAVGGTPAHPAGTAPSRSGVSSRARGRQFHRLVVGVGVVGVGLLGALRGQVGVVGAVVAVGSRRPPEVVVGGQHLVLVGALPPKHIRGLSVSFS